MSTSRPHLRRLMTRMWGRLNGKRRGERKWERKEKGRGSRPFNQTSPVLDPYFLQIPPIKKGRRNRLKREIEGKEKGREKDEPLRKARRLVPIFRG